MLATPTATATATMIVPTTTQPTLSTNISRLASVLSPCSAIRSAKLCAPTIRTPTTRIAIEMPATSSAASAICQAIPLRRRIMAAARRCSPIAGATDRGDVAWLLGVVAQLVPQSTDVNIDRAVHDPGFVVSVHGVQQLIAGQHPTVRLEQRDEESEFDGGQRDVLLTDTNLMAIAIHDEVTVVDQALGGGCFGGARWLGPFQDPLDTQHELRGREGLREVVVGTSGQAGDAIVDEAARRQDDDRRPIGPTNRAQDREAVHLRQHDVQDDEGRHLERDRGEGAPAVGRLHHAIARPLEIRPHEADDLHVVVDDEDRASICTACGCHAGHRRCRAMTAA